MIVPCIDLMGGRAVQLEHGRDLKLAVDDLDGLLERFRRYHALHVIDLDAALGKGDNTAQVRHLLQRATMPVRVGGGVRTLARARELADLGAAQVIVGSSAFRDGAVDRRFLTQLRNALGPRRVVIALDTEGGKIVVRGWRERLALEPRDVVAGLGPYCAAFLCTQVDREGSLRGVDREWFRTLRDLTNRPIIAAGGVRSRADVRALARLGMDAAIGMALYAGVLSRIPDPGAWTPAVS